MLSGDAQCAPILQISQKARLWGVSQGFAWKSRIFALFFSIPFSKYLFFTLNNIRKKERKSSIVVITTIIYYIVVLFP